MAASDGWVLMASTEGEPGVPVAVNSTLPAPVALARTVWPPVVGPRVHSVEACPSEPVDAVCGDTEPPPDRTSQLTVTPLTA